MKLYRTIRNLSPRTKMLLKLLFSTSLFTLTMLGMTYAWLSGHSVSENVAVMPELTVAIEESDDDVTYDGWTDPGIIWGSQMPKYTRFTNTGTASVVIRVSYAHYWTATILVEGVPTNVNLSNLISIDSINNQIATPIWSADGFGNSDLWYAGADGWMYYRHVLEPGESSASVIEGVEFISPMPTEDYSAAEYSLQFFMEACQYSTNIENENEIAAWECFEMTYTEAGGLLTWSSAAP